MLGSCFVSCRRSAFPINDFEIWAPWKWEEPPPVALNPLWDSTYTCFPNLNYARTGTCFGVGGVKVHAWRSDKVSVSQLFFHFRVYFLTSRKCDLQSYLSWDLVLLTALSWHQMALALMKQCAFPTSPTASPDHADPAYFQHSVSSICRMCLSEEALICNSDRSSSDACADGFPSHALMHYFVHDAQLGRRLSRYLTGLCYLSASSQLPPPPSASFLSDNISAAPFNTCLLFTRKIKSRAFARKAPALLLVFLLLWSQPEIYSFFLTTYTHSNIRNLIQSCWLLTVTSWTDLLCRYVNRDFKHDACFKCEANRRSRSSQSVIGTSRESLERCEHYLCISTPPFCAVWEEKKWCWVPDDWTGIQCSTSAARYSK